MVNGDAAGTYVTPATLDLTAETSGIRGIGSTDATGGTPAAVATISLPQGVYRYLDATNGANILTPDGVIQACEPSSSNGVIPGSR